jgi:hypothetical protein
MKWGKLHMSSNLINVRRQYLGSLGSGWTAADDERLRYELAVLRPAKRLGAEVTFACGTCATALEPKQVMLRVEPEYK